MILHIFPDEKFTEDYIERVNRLFHSVEHYFYIYTKGERRFCNKEFVESLNNVGFINDLFQKESKFVEIYKKSERVIFHGLFLRYFDMLYFYRLKKRYNKYYVWVIWGGDLYDFYNAAHKNPTIILFMKEMLRKKFIEQLEAAVTNYDYEELKERYKTSAIHQMAIYSYQLFPEAADKVENGTFTKVMVGHSATKTCRHQETFELLRPYVGKIQVYCPLSYPDNKTYIAAVEKRGREIFGNQFFPLKEFMPYDKYISFLGSIDIGIFNNNRQQGMGNITNLLYLGKKVYLSKDNNIRKVYCRPSYIIFDSEKIEETEFFRTLSKKEKERNRKQIELFLSDKEFVRSWGEIFYKKAQK